MCAARVTDSKSCLAGSGGGSIALVPRRGEMEARDFHLIWRSPSSHRAALVGRLLASDQAAEAAGVREGVICWNF